MWAMPFFFALLVFADYPASHFTDEIKDNIQPLLLLLFFFI
jgi:hypothetical protein